MSEISRELICVGAIVGARGLKGEVRIKSFTAEPTGISNYGDLFEKNGYYINFSGQKSYNGVAFISKAELEDVRIDLTGELPEDSDAILLSDQKRIISALCMGIRVVNVYVPNGSSLSSEKYTYKIKWLNCLKKYLEGPSERFEPLCVLGDFNIAPEDRDIHNPEKLCGGLMASEQERIALKDLLNNKLEDVFRVFEPETGHWSWWDYRTSAWERDRGWRIDQIYLSEDLIRNAKNCQIHKKIRGNVQPSDHAPVIAEISWPTTDYEDLPLEL